MGIKVLLVLPNSFMDNMIPLAIPLLSSCLKDAGHETKLFDTTFYRTRKKTGDDARVETLQVQKTNLEDFGITKKKTDMIDDFKKMVEEYKPDLIGVNAIDITWPIGLKLLNSIKDYKIPKIVGGVHATLEPEDIIKEESVDMVCAGEGEDAIVELANKIRDNKDYSDIRNFWVKKDGKLIKNPLRNLKNIDEIPIADRTIFDKKRFYKPMRGKVWVMLPIELDRSCPHNCTYCSNKGLHEVYKGKGSYFRHRSIDKVMDEVRYLKEKFKLEYIYFVAANFLVMNDKRFNEFITKYREFKIPFYIDTRPETITKEKVQALESVECKSMAIGIEHGDDEFRKKHLNRSISDETMIKSVEIVKKHSNIKISINSIIGFPYETRELIFKTIELNRKINPDSRMVNIFNPYSGTKLREISLKEGFIKPGELAGDYRSDAMLDMPQLSKEEIKGLQRTFIMYAELPRYMFPLIEKAEKDDKMFALLTDVYDKFKNGK